MDWYLNGDEPRLLSALRRDIVAYLRRHATADSDLDDAELVVGEAVGNAVRHAGGPIWVSVTWRQESPTLTVQDLGPGFDTSLVSGAVGQGLTGLDRELEDLVGHSEPSWPPRGGPAVDAVADSGRGLMLITHLAPALQAHARHGAGMTVSVELPVRKPAAISHDPPHHDSSALPALEEVRPDGGFGKESFLRALVVQLAKAVEFEHGPDAADAAVAQVGADVGGQMEREFRAATAVVGRMTPEQMAHCYVRLKHAIDGGFYVIEANEERIILGNTRCPFGDVVRQAPSLCRMTSSVFGGIAARNSEGGAWVLLEERIAVGDPGCRVVVHLREPPAGEQPLAHRYAAPR